MLKQNSYASVDIEKIW